MLSTDFNAKVVKDQIVSWIRSWFDHNGKDCNAVIGISGGKDSTVAAALCVEALGKERVIGVMIPQGKQADIADSQEVCKHLDISNYTINIEKMFMNLKETLKENNIIMTNQATINAPPRIRMTVLYAVSQTMNGRVVNTCNLSEDYVGYSTKYGDTAGDFAPLKSLTSEEVIEIGKTLNLPEHLLTKAPSDGLCGKTDEDNLGFTYEVLNKYIRTGVIEDESTKKRIDRLHIINEHKERMIPKFLYYPVEKNEW